MIKLNIAILALALTDTTRAACRYSKRALDDPDFVKEHLTKRDEPKAKRQATFSVNQLIDVTGEYAWVAPGPNDLRGPCPGLNALANHGYFPHNGVVRLSVGASATEQVYGLAADLGEPLTTYSTLGDGDVVHLEHWGKAAGGLEYTHRWRRRRSLSGSHNNNENDASVTRGDYYLYNGDVSSVRVEKFQTLYNLQTNAAVPNCDLDVLIQHRKYTFDNSESTNPYFYMSPFGGLVVGNGAHLFIPLMSNHSTDYPAGILAKETLKSFFAITEAPDGTLTYAPGYERIPENWYRRPLGVANEYSATSFATDLTQMASVVPEALCQRLYWHRE